MRPMPDVAVFRQTVKSFVPWLVIWFGLVVIPSLVILVPRAHAQSPSTVGRWSLPSPTKISNDAAIAQQTPIHMAWMRGQADWATNPNSFHSYLFWWESRADVCASPRKFHGALYGWRPGMDLGGTGTMMDAGFTLLPLGDVELDPSGDATGHNIFCSGHTLLDDGRLLVAGGAGAPENNGTNRAAIFDPLVTGNGSRWTHLSNFSVPRWYPSIVQTASREVFTYAGLQYASMNLIGGSPGAGSPTNEVARHRLNDAAGWDATVVPAEDPDPNISGERSPQPRDFMA